MDTKFLRQIRLAGVIVQTIGLFGYPILFWLGFTIFAGTFMWSIIKVENYFLFLEEQANKKKKSDEEEKSEE